MPKPKIVAVNETLANIGSNARIEKGRKRIVPVGEAALGQSSYSETEDAWYVFEAVDTTGDENTTDTIRWEEVGMFDTRDEAVSAAFDFAE